MSVRGGNVIPLVRKMSVVRTPGTGDKPMIRIANRFLLDYGFKIGSTVEVSYQPGVIIIKLNKKYESNNIQEKRSVSLSITSDTEAF